MANEPKDQTQDEAEAPPVAIPVSAQPIELAALEAEIERFWANLLANVSNRVETTVHNYLHTETEALKARLKSLF